MKMMRLAFGLSLLAGAALADQAKVENATARQSGATWTFEVTISHPDTGWDHYADGWAVLAPDGTELGYRKLHHPHENEQPFTRSLSGVAIPDNLTEVKIRAHDSVHGWSDQLYTVRIR
ncbi:MAG: hypothetical protein AAF700_01810 [Pseudomonadota bacterium]